MAHPPHTPHPAAGRQSGFLSAPEATPAAAGPGASVREHAALPLAEREQQYSPSSCIGGNYAPHIADYRSHSAAAAARWPHHAGLRWGTGAAHTLDLFLPPAGPAGAPVPLLVFIHGGYWQELGKADSLFPAEGCLAAGVAFAAIDYTLAPAATVPDIARECRQALRWLHAHAAAYGIDPGCILVAGSSAGAHLAAMCGLRNWPGYTDLPAGLPAACVLVSGIYELAPLAGTSIDQALALTPPQIAEASPLRCKVEHFPTALLAWGAIETEAFKQQSTAFAAHICAAGGQAIAQEIAGRNHFDVVLGLADPATPLGRAVHALLHLCRATGAHAPD